MRLILHRDPGIEDILYAASDNDPGAMYDDLDDVMIVLARAREYAARIRKGVVVRAYEKRTARDTAEMFGLSAARIYQLVGEYRAGV